MVAADHDRRLHLALPYHLVEGEADPRPLAESEPADPCRQALELDLLPRHVEPVVEMAVAGDQRLDLGVGAIDVLGLAGERAPAERPDAAAEERAYIGRHEAREVESVGDPLLFRHLADVVAVIESREARAMEVG